MTRAFDPEVTEVLWATIEPLLPPADDSHPLGCHNPRVPDKVCFRGILIRLVTGASWTDVEAIMDFVVSDTTLRRRRDEWIDAGVFDALEAMHDERFWVLPHEEVGEYARRKANDIDRWLAGMRRLQGSLYSDGALPGDAIAPTI